MTDGGGGKCLGVNALDGHARQLSLGITERIDVHDFQAGDALVSTQRFPNPL